MRLDKKDANRKTRDFLGFSSFFAVFLTFFEIRILTKIKRCQSAFLSKGVEVNLYLAFLGDILAIFHRRYLPFFITISLVKSVFFEKAMLAAA